VQAELEAAKKGGKQFLVYKTDMGNDGKMMKRWGRFAEKQQRPHRKPPQIAKPSKFGAQHT
jgi:hypothetical protein